jgi:hypothetical protein
VPFRSRAQLRYMFARHPRIARRWADEYGVPKDLPERASSKREAIKRRLERKRR